MENIIKKAIERHKLALNFLENNTSVILDLAELFISTFKKGGKIIFMGNGGSASDALHLSAEFVGRFKKNRKPLDAISLSTNIPTITAIGNDFGFEYIFSRQIMAIAKKNDLVVGISTSGNSKNIINAIKEAKDMNIKTIGFLGKDGGLLKDIVDVALIIPSDDTATVQEMHILVGHIICEIIDERFS